MGATGLRRLLTDVVGEYVARRRRGVWGRRRAPGRGARRCAVVRRHDLWERRSSPRHARGAKSLRLLPDSTRSSTASEQIYIADIPPLVSACITRERKKESTGEKSTPMRAAAFWRRGGPRFLNRATEEGEAHLWRSRRNELKTASNLLCFVTLRTSVRSLRLAISRAPKETIAHLTRAVLCLVVFSRIATTNDRKNARGSRVFFKRTCCDVLRRSSWTTDLERDRQRVAWFWGSCSFNGFTGFRTRTRGRNGDGGGDGLLTQFCGRVWFDLHGSLIFWFSMSPCSAGRTSRCQATFSNLPGRRREEGEGTCRVGRDSCPWPKTRRDSSSPSCAGCVRSRGHGRLAEHGQSRRGRGGPTTIHSRSGRHRGGRTTTRRSGSNRSGRRGHTHLVGRRIGRARAGPSDRPRSGLRRRSVLRTQGGRDGSRPRRVAVHGTRPEWARAGESSPKSRHGVVDREGPAEPRRHSQSWVHSVRGGTRTHEAVEVVDRLLRVVDVCHRDETETTGSTTLCDSRA